MDVFDKMSKDLLELSKDYMQKKWAQYTLGLDFGILEAQNKRDNYLKDKKKYEFLKSHSEVPLKADKRKYEILESRFSDFHRSTKTTGLINQIDEISNKLSNILNKFRRNIDGRDYTSAEVSEIILNNDDEDSRKKAYLSAVPVNKLLVDNGFIDLIRLRNDLSVELGFDNFIKYSFHSDDLSPSFIDLDSFAEACDFSKAKDYYSALSKKHINDDSNKPWNSSYVDKEVSKINHKEISVLKVNKYLQFAFDEMGFDFDTSQVTMDLYSRKNKSEWGYNFTMEPAVDSRILANIDGKYSDLRVLLHEMGHALHFLSLDKHQYTFNQAISGLVAEGFANDCAKFMYDEKSFQYFNIELTNSERSEINMLNDRRKYSILFGIPAMIFDMDLYLKEPKSLNDLNERSLELNSLLYSLDDIQAYPWGRLIHHTTHPIYLHNYFVGDLFFSDLKKYDIYPKTNNAGWLVDNVLKACGEHKFEDLYQSIIGSKFDLIKSLNGFS